tara:strand:- start:259 stop:498 length:240 start_codon:yes stop_codon:yes gene_type:complete
MSKELDKFNEFVDWFWELVFGTERRPKPKRARDTKGRYKGDDLTTKDVNEAWVGGKAPKKKRKKNVKRKTNKRTTKRTR